MSKNTQEPEENWEKNAENFVKSTEVTEETIEKTPPKSLGKAQKFQDENRPLMADIGYKNIPIDHLPSGGIFYPNGTQIAIRSATVNEIRHWSTIDEEDLLGVDDMLNYVIEKCARIKIPETTSSWKDIKDIDRFYIIFAIREYTFKNGENRIYVKDGEGGKIEVRKDMIKYFELHEKLKQYYSHEDKNIHLNLKTGEEIPVYMPSIGISQFIKNYIRGKQQQGKNFDQAFVKFAPFIFNDWRVLNQLTYEKEVQDSSAWTLQKISVLSKMTDYLGEGVSAEVAYQSPSGAELTAPLDIEGGIKSIFLISNIFDELV